MGSLYLLCAEQSLRALRALRFCPARSCGCCRSLLELPRKVSALTVK